MVHERMWDRWISYEVLILRRDLISRLTAPQRHGIYEWEQNVRYERYVMLYIVIFVSTVRSRVVCF
jgi:hypothetical protein